MNNTQIIISIILIILIIFLIYKKNNEYLTNMESINNIAKIYADISGTAYFNNISSNKIFGLDASFNNISSNRIVGLDASFNNISVNNININNNNNDNKARYIRIGNDLPGVNLSNPYWNVTSVKVFDISGNNVSDSKSVTIDAGTQWRDSSDVIQSGQPTIITSPTPTFRNSTVDYQYLYQGGGGTNALKIDLGQEFDIKQIIIWGRYYPSWYQRLNNTSIKLIGADGVTVKKTIYSGTWETLSKEFYL